MSIERIWSSRTSSNLILSTLLLTCSMKRTVWALYRVGCVAAEKTPQSVAMTTQRMTIQARDLMAK